MVEAARPTTPLPAAAFRAFRAFRDRFRGEIVTPDDPGYERGRRVWNAMWDRRPALIVRPLDPDDVAAAIRFGREADLPIAVRGGGHGGAGHGTIDHGLVIDLAALRDVQVDPTARIATVGGGALLSQLDAAAQHDGLVCPVGVVGHTGVGGLTLGGGNGRLQRRFGLTIDNVRAVELVTAEGRQVRACRDEQPELFWAIRGAGANFGVVTSFELALHPFDGGLTRSIRIFDGAHAWEAWQTFRDFAVEAPHDFSLTFAIGRAVPEADYPPEIAGDPVALIGFTHCGDPRVVERGATPLLAGPEPLTISTGTGRYLDVQASADDAMGWGHRSFMRSAFANDLRHETIDAMVAVVADAPGESSFSVAALGGAIADPAADATAYAGRTARFDVSADGMWDDAAEDEPTIGWIDRAMELAEADAVGGRYVNGTNDQGPEVSRSIYASPIYERLVEVKAVWDPDNVFRSNHNIPPPG